MDELQKEINKIKVEAKKIGNVQPQNVKNEIKENYKIGIEYYKDIEKDKK